MEHTLENDIDYWGRLSKTLMLSFEEHYSYATPPEFILEVRDEIQERLRNEPASRVCLQKLRVIDSALLERENLQKACKWVEGIFYRKEHPRSHWWWYLPEINYGVMPKPDLDAIINS